MASPDQPPFRAAMAALAATVPSVVSSYAAGRPRDPEQLAKCVSTVNNYGLEILTINGAHAALALLHSKLADPLLQLLAHSGRESFGADGDSQTRPLPLQLQHFDAEEFLQRLLWERTHLLLCTSLRRLGASVLDAPTRRAAEAFIQKLLRTGTLRCCSRALAEAAPQGGRGSLTAMGFHTVVMDIGDYADVACLDPFLRRCGAAADPSSGATSGRPGGGGGALCRALTTELSASGVLDHAARLVVQDLITSGGSAAAVAAGGGGGVYSTGKAFRALTTAAEAFDCAVRGGTAGRSGDVFTAALVPPPTQPLTPPWGPCAQYLTLAAAVTTLAAAGYGGGSDGGGGEGAGDGGGGGPSGGGGSGGSDGSRCRGTYGLPGALARALWGAVTPKPGPGLEAERLFAVLLSMVEAEADRAAAAIQPPDRPGGGGSEEDVGGGSGTGGGGADGAVDGGAGGSGGAAPGGWSFLVGPRAAHVLCMRIAHLAVEAREVAAATATTTAAGGGSPEVPPPQTPLLLQPRGARHLAARALTAAQSLLLGPLAARRRRRAHGGGGAAAAAAEAATAAAVAGGALPTEHWEAVVRALRVPVVASAAPASSSAVGASDGCDLVFIGRLPGAGLGGMMAVPGLGAGGLLPSSPPAALAPALSSGLLPALECCVRALGRSADPRDVGSLCELLRGSLLEQSGGLAAVIGFGPPRQAVPLLASLAKVLHRCVDAVKAEAANAAAAVAAGPSVPQSRPQEDVRERVCANVADLAALMGRALSAVWTDPWVPYVAGGAPTLGKFKHVLADASAATSDSNSTAAAPGPDDPRQLRQLRCLLPLLLQRWLPALARAVALAPCLPRQCKLDMYGAAQDSLRGLVVALLASADPQRLKWLALKANMVIAMRGTLRVFAEDDGNGGGDGGNVDAGSGRSGGSSRSGDGGVRTVLIEDEIAAATAALSSPEAGPRAERWRRWLDANIKVSPARMLCELLVVNMPHLTWDAARVRALLDCLLAAAIAQTEQLQLEMAGAAAAVTKADGPGLETRAAGAGAAAMATAARQGGGVSYGGGGGGSRGGGHGGGGRRGGGSRRRPAPKPAPAVSASASASSAPPPGQDPELLLFLEQRFGQVLGLGCVRADRALSEYSSHVYQAVRGICALDFDGWGTGAASALCDRRALALLRLAVSLEPPAGEGPEPPAEGLPPACTNPRCTNLAGESDAGLMAAVEAAGGGGRDGGGDGSSGRNGGSGGAGLRACCSPECQRASEGRSAEGGGGGRAEAKAGAAAGRHRKGR
ncbi:hypothetical protein GPECTOR_3g357 [Gonium pectorale]|uniref:Uncharacterized protein n=1 Tax=Gonium pectorale TaxID=33097 RepID=A0A150GZK7_GONPE|nr:hypothetical protein GPECTOR_3g357 [Gonium pectorale]|eukprot:KXZ55214.1 hypothetical protein GPECTOR_3g357 [Gonium pectorale]